MMLDATRKYADPLAEERLFGWHAALFPTGRSGMRRITVGVWRPVEAGPMGGRPSDSQRGPRNQRDASLDFVSLCALRESGGSVYMGRRMLPHPG